jgi:hypothetical protein
MGNPWQAVGGVVKRHCKTGEPDALKDASPVRRGAVGNVITTVRMWITRAGRLPDLVGTFPRTERRKTRVLGFPRTPKTGVVGHSSLSERHGNPNAHGTAQERTRLNGGTLSAIPPPLREAPSRSHAPLLSISRTEEWRKKPHDFQSRRSVTRASRERKQRIRPR